MSQPNSPFPGGYSQGPGALLPQAAMPAAPQLPAAGRNGAPSPATGAMAAATAANQPPALDTERFDWAEALQSAPPWLVSMVLHMLVLICLGLMVATLDKETTKVNIEAVYGDTFAEERGDQLIEKNPLDLAAEKPDLNATQTEYSPIDMPAVEHPLAVPALGSGPLATSFSPNGRLVAGGTEGIQAPIGLALHGRERGFKKVLMGKYGGTKTTEAAVQAALGWLKRNQRTNGLWALNGPYSDGGESQNHIAATAMALLAFQGNGNTHLENSDIDHDYRQTVKKGWDALLKLQTSEGQFVERDMPTYHTLYSHAQATIALCELYGMTHDSSFRAPAERAIRFCVKSQDAAGGWRYQPGNDSDMSVTGWFVMALQSALMAGLEVPSSTLQNVNRFLDAMQDSTGSRYHYHAGNYTNNAMTAEGLLCRQYLGWKRDDERLVNGVQFLSAAPIDAKDPNVYYWYYATQVMHHMGGSYWTRWNDVMRQAIPETQVKKGPEEGSWDPSGDAYSGQGGRLYVTCLRTYMLEVYYRHLPIYGDIYKDQTTETKADAKEDQK